MAKQTMNAVVYFGVRYPITDEIAHKILERISEFEILSHSDFVQFPTTDGRQIVLRVGPSIPIAFEGDNAIGG